MPYQSSGLSALNYANSFTLWHYRTTDLAVDVLGDGYFNAAHKMLRPGDFVLVNAQIDAEPFNGILVVMSNDNGAVSVSADGWPSRAGVPS